MLLTIEMKITHHQAWLPMFSVATMKDEGGEKRMSCFIFMLA
jgi:hypothetical protein